MTNNNMALIVVDVQRDFCEGGSLAVSGGAAVATKISDFLRKYGIQYGTVVFTRDWHTPHSVNGGHFAENDEPDFKDTWPVHCVADTPGAEFHPNLTKELGEWAAVQIYKGQGAPAYSGFEGVTSSGKPLHDVLQTAGVEVLDVCGIATDYCVKATAIDAAKLGYKVNVSLDMCAGVAAETTEAAATEMREAGIRVLDGTGQ